VLGVLSLVNLSVEFAKTGFVKLSVAKGADMARMPRKFVVDEDEVGVYHCINRCVRRAFLCGTDEVSGQCFDHRKQFIQDRRVARPFTVGCRRHRMPHRPYPICQSTLNLSSPSIPGGHRMGSPTDLCSMYQRAELHCQATA
jgi:hypothetical protein